LAGSQQSLIVGFFGSLNDALKADVASDFSQRRRARAGIVIFSIRGYLPTDGRLG